MKLAHTMHLCLSLNTQSNFAIVEHTARPLLYRGLGQQHSTVVEEKVDKVPTLRTRAPPQRGGTHVCQLF